MTHPSHQTNGASLEDCHTNFFALVSDRFSLSLTHSLSRARYPNVEKFRFRRARSDSKFDSTYGLRLAASANGERERERSLENGSERPKVTAGISCRTSHMSLTTGA